MIFDYPRRLVQRRHAPAGYSNVDSFRPWLRDEFEFRCVYCLKRETWGPVTGDFALDHFQPQSLAPQQRLEYDNLVYACQRCNFVKGAERTEVPHELHPDADLRMEPDGELLAFTPTARRFVLQLDLNSPRMKSWRRMWLRIVHLAQQHDVDLLRRLVGFPNDLPNLLKLRPPSNDRPDGVNESWLARRLRGELPAAY